MTELNVRAERQEDTLRMGLRQEWISGEDENGGVARAERDDEGALIDGPQWPR